MKLSTKGRYAVMAMVDLAFHCRGNPVALADVAERQEISLSYLEQIFGKIRRGGLVKSVRGQSGWLISAQRMPAIKGWVSVALPAILLRVGFATYLHCCSAFSKAKEEFFPGDRLLESH